MVNRERFDVCRTWDARRMKTALLALTLALTGWVLLTATAARMWGSTAWLLSGGVACIGVAVMLLGVRWILLVATEGVSQFLDPPAADEPERRRPGKPSLVDRLMARLRR